MSNKKKFIVSLANIRQQFLSKQLYQTSSRKNVDAFFNDSSRTITMAHLLHSRCDQTG